MGPVHPGPVPGCLFLRGQLADNTGIPEIWMRTPMSHAVPLSILGGLTAEQFLQDYWQKKPLLVRNALPALAGLFEPADLRELAVQEGVTARLLIEGDGSSGRTGRWQVRHSPLTAKDFKKLPPRYTLLVQAVDHWSLELSQLWQQLDFLPQWRRDDVMISYAPRGGSVGQHFDWYDVFLVQAHGARRWQLGKWCTADTPLLPDQPLRLLTDLGEVFFDEIVQPGDLLYVPPGLSHHGVAENDCLTASFGFRMPSARQLLERLVDEVLAEPATQIPLREQRTQPVQQTALVPQTDLEALSSQLRTLLEDPHWLNQAAMALLSESNFPDTQSSHDPLDAAEWAAALADGVQGLRDPAVRLLYTESGEFWLNGERLPAQPEHRDVLQALANGEILSAAELAVLDAATVSDWLERGLLLLDLAED